MWYVTVNTFYFSILDIKLRPSRATWATDEEEKKEFRKNVESPCIAFALIGN